MWEQFTKYRIAVWIVALILIALPFILYMLSRSTFPIQLATLFRKPQKSIESNRYSVRSDIPGYRIKLVDNAYLDYVTQSLGIFGAHAVTDPRTYRGFPDLTLRHTVSKVQLVLAPKIDPFIVAISGKNDFLGRGDYRVENDTLIISISLNMDELGSGAKGGQFAIEDAYVQTLGSIWYYAHGISDNMEVNGEALGKITSDIKEYLHSGVLPWPIRIEKI